MKMIMSPNHAILDDSDQRILLNTVALMPWVCAELSKAPTEKMDSKGRRVMMDLANIWDLGGEKKIAGAFANVAQDKLNGVQSFCREISPELIRICRKSKNHEADNTLLVFDL